MDRHGIIDHLKEELSRIEHAIAALEGSHSHAVAHKKRGGGITAAGRRRLSALMKKRWAERKKKAGKKSKK